MTGSFRVIVRDVHRPVTLFLAAILLASCATTRPADRKDFRIVGYVMGRTDIQRISPRKLTHINYAFAKVRGDGVIVFENPDGPAHVAQLQSLKGKNPNLKIIVSVGGWGAEWFSDAALDEASRCRFATSARELVEKFALDGIDLDWEYPGQAGAGNRFRKEDRGNFTLLLKAVRHELDLLSDARRRTGADRYTLTIASTGGGYFQHTEMDRLHEHLDWINIMTYDLAGGWSRVTGHHTPLHTSKMAPGWGSTESYVMQHLRAGIPPEKVVVGVAFYAKVWKWVDRKSSGLAAPYDFFAPSMSYSRLVTGPLRDQSFEQRWDEVAKAPYLWEPELGTFISYDDPRSLREKARFVRAHGLGGIMYWEHGHDPDETLLDTVVRSLR